MLESNKNPFRQIYALITKECNLHCPHCNVATYKDDFNNDKFINQLENFNGNIIIFGGEPLMYPERILSLLDNKKISKKINSISTNLTLIDSDKLKILSRIKNIATSWNPSRFNLKQYNTWINNIDNLKKIENINLIILITITKDLIDMNIDKLLSIISNWDNEIIQGIRFEEYVGDEVTPEFLDEKDVFLCNLYKKWNQYTSIKFLNAIQIKNNKYIYDHNCAGIFTLEPNGDLFNRCPHPISKYVPDECLYCEKASICRPCSLQKYCSYPKKFINLVKMTEG